MTAPIASRHASTVGRDPLLTLRAWHSLAPWSLRDLAAIAGTLLEASGVVPVNVAARARPSERTIRFYVMRGLVEPPEGRGTSAVYRYRHLLQVLGIKLRQMEGASLEALTAEFSGLTGDVLEKRVAGALGPGLPGPEELGSLEGILPTRGRAARALKARVGTVSARHPSDHAAPRATLVRRVVIAPGAELALEAAHPLFRHAGAEERIGQAVAEALSAVLAELDPTAASPLVPERAHG